MTNYSEIQKLWKSYEINTLGKLEKYLSNFRIHFAYNSGKIENNNITFNDTKEIFENNKVLNYTGDSRTIFEQQNQKLCYEFLKSKIINKEPLTLDLIKEIHRILTSGTYDERRYIENGERPGELKKHDYVVGEAEVGTRPDEVSSQLENMLQEVNAYSGNKHLTTAAYLHASFEYIHPFADGNGRVGRTVLNYYLMTHDEPPLIVFDEEKNLYYDSLKAFDLAENIVPLKKFLEMETIRTWSKTLKRMQVGTKQRKMNLYDDLGR